MSKRAGMPHPLGVEPDLLRDAIIVCVLGVVLVVARVPWRWVILILALAVGVTVLVDAFLSELVGEG